MSLISFQLKAFHKSHLLKLRVAPSETAMTDVLREVYFFVSLVFSLNSELEIKHEYVQFW